MPVGTSRNSSTPPNRRFQHVKSENDLTHILHIQKLVEEKLKLKGGATVHNCVTNKNIREPHMITKQDMVVGPRTHLPGVMPRIRSYRTFFDYIEAKEEKETRVLFPWLLSKKERYCEFGKSIGPEYPTTKESSDKQLLPNKHVLSGKPKKIIIDVVRTVPSIANADEFEKKFMPHSSETSDSDAPSNYIFARKAKIDSANNETEIIVRFVEMTADNMRMLSLDYTEKILKYLKDYDSSFPSFNNDGCDSDHLINNLHIERPLVFNKKQPLKYRDCACHRCLEESSNFNNCDRISKFKAISAADMIKVKKLKFNKLKEEQQGDEIIKKNSDTNIQEPNECFEKTEIPYLMKFVNAGELKCKICSVSVENNKNSVENHVNSVNHILKYKEFFTKNYIRGFGTDWLFCKVCKINIMTPYEILHTKQATHKERLKSVKSRMNNTEGERTSLVDCISNSENNMRVPIQEHKISDNVEPITSNQDTKNYKPKDTQDVKIHYLMKYISEQELQCKVCHVSLENNCKQVDDHVFSEIHANEYIKYLAKNHIRGIGSDRLYCLLCKVNIIKPYEVLHTKTVSHKGKMKSNRKKLLERNTEIDNEPKLPVYYCKFCRTYIPNDNSTILYHKNSLKHAKNVESHIESF